MIDTLKSRSDSSRRFRAAESAIQSTPSPPSISYNAVYRQIDHDILSKEVQTSPTYSYQWVADQAGHTAVGAFIVLLLWWIFEDLVPSNWSAAAAFAIATILIAVVEAKDYLQARARIANLFNAARDLKDLRNNASVAAFYVILGGGVALSALLRWTPWLIPLFVVAIILPVPYWVRQKIRFQQAGLPFLFRLPEFKLDGLTQDVAAKIDQFIRTSGDASPKHIALIG